MKFEPTREFYLKNNGRALRVGRTPRAEVCVVETHTQSGSWERGFKFHDSKWACLKRHRRGQPVEYSMDHGKTWHYSLQLARKSRGKLKLNTDTRSELAFESIQKINRDYYGPGYKWRP